MGHLEYAPMPGGATAINKPYRMALGYLYSLLGDIDSDGLPYYPGDIEAEIIKRQVEKKLNAPLTSSMGRLFDAVASITGVRQEIDYEAQAAIELEMLAPKAVDAQQRNVYPFTIDTQSGVNIIRLADLFRGVITDVRTGIPVPEISAKLHLTVAEMTVKMCRLISQETGLNRVALSGGVFQNRLLLRLTRSRLEEAGFTVITHHIVPCNDGGIALGQAVVAQFTNQ
jgi:hydrogenase maturation protein HypF